MKYFIENNITAWRHGGRLRTMAKTLPSNSRKQLNKMAQMARIQTRNTHIRFKNYLYTQCLIICFIQTEKFDNEQTQRE